MNFKELRIASGMNKKQFSEYFGIPYRTVQNWELGEREYPRYLFDLMVYKLEGENIMMKSKEELTLRKEGQYWTLYIGDAQCGCGYLEDMTEQMREVGERLDKGEDVENIITEMNTFY